MLLSHYPLRVLRLGQGTKNQEKKQVIKNIISQLQVSPEPSKCLDLLSQLRPLLKPPFGNQHLIRLLNSSLQFFFPIQYTQHTSQCWICISVSLTTHGNSLTLNLAVIGSSRPFLRHRSLALSATAPDLGHGVTPPGLLSIQ